MTTGHLIFFSGIGLIAVGIILLALSIRAESSERKRTAAEIGQEY